MTSTKSCHSYVPREAGQKTLGTSGREKGESGEAGRKGDIRLVTDYHKKSFFLLSLIHI